MCIFCIVSEPTLRGASKTSQEMLHTTKSLLLMRPYQFSYLDETCSAQFVNVESSYMAVVKYKRMAEFMIRGV